MLRCFISFYCGWYFSTDENARQTFHADVMASLSNVDGPLSLERSGYCKTIVSSACTADEIFCQMRMLGKRFKQK